MRNPDAKSKDGVYSHSFVLQWLWILVLVPMAGILLFTNVTAGEIEEIEVKYKELTPEEERVIINKGTEKPFSGEYWDHKEDGTYLCRRCNAPLYKSEDKFDSQCGWPSFDDEISGAVKRIPDADGMRTEILCSNCGAHLGHVFLGEGFTDKNARHCVNSISMDFSPAETEADLQKAYFAGGCFWGVEYYLQKVDGVISTRVGYIGGHKKEPTYIEVCSDNTGHAEAIEVVYDPSRITFEEVARYFFEIHDPTQVDRQGPDIGNQYRSAIFYANEEQKQISQKLINILEKKGFRIATELSEAGTFWEAEKFHQDYYLKNGHQPYCHSYKKRF